LLDVSIQVLPRRIAPRAPPAPTIASATSFGPGNIVIRTSATAAASAAVDAHRAPLAETGAWSSVRRSCATTTCPARTRLAHIGMPIRPVPSNPIISTASDTAEVEPLAP
jgi:hypothetical protein